LNSKKYFKNLDATRFVAFLAVFSEHTFVSTNGVDLNEGLFQQTSSFVKSFAFLGLEYFFVLSSFLITYIALEEIKINRNFKAKAFVIRRALRVFPLYFLIVAIAYLGGYFISFFVNDFINTLPPLSYFITFTVNFFTINNGTDFLFFLVFLWSISIEEQFYIFWAIMLKFFIKHIKAISVILIIVSLAFRTYYTIYDYNQDILFFHTLSALGNFGVGSLLAIYCFRNNKFQSKISNIPKMLNIIVYLLFLLFIILYENIFSSDISIILERLIFSCFFAYIIAEQAYNENSILKLGNIKYFDYLGKISYGLYCFHGLIITILVKALGYFSYKENLIDNMIIYPVLILFFTILISSISYKYYESWFLKLKKKFSAT